MRRTVFAAAIGMLSLGFLGVPALAQSVQYDVLFDSTWSAATHPIDWPGSSAHYSSLVGATHNSEVSFWEVGELSTVGIQRVAETGGTSVFRTEIQAAIDAGTAANLVTGRGLADSPGSLATSFVVDADHSEITLVTMIAPSPDWFVGVSGLDLRDGGTWQEEVVVDLYPYDSGSDSGTTYRSPNESTNPHVPVFRIEDGPVGNGTPLGTFTFSLATLLGDADMDGDVDSADQTILSTNWTGAMMFGEGTKGLGEGDFDGDGDVDTADQTTLARNWTGAQQATTAVTSNIVPEPSGIALAMVGLFVLAIARGVPNRR